MGHVERGKHMANLDDSGLFVLPDEYEDTTDLSAAKDAAMPDYIMPDKVYDVLKWLVVIVLPALSTLIADVGDKLGIQDPKGVALIIVKVALFFGTCIGASQVSAMGRVKRDWQ